LPPAVTVWDVGCVVIAGTVSTVSVTALLATLLWTEFEARHWY